MTHAFLGLGSNLGDRLGNLESAVAALSGATGVTVLAVSPVYRTEPVGLTDQPEFLNAVVKVETGLSPRELLALVTSIEDANDRVRYERWGPRTLDIDILLYGDEEILEDDLVTPHPRLRERRFALAPLASIESGASLPDGKTVGELLEELDDEPHAEQDPGLVIRWPAGAPGRSVAVIGAGKVGTAMAGLLRSRDYRVVSVYDPVPEAMEAAARVSGAWKADTPAGAVQSASIVLLTTPDDAIEDTCRQIAESGTPLEGKFFIHMSGALGLRVLEPASCAGASVLSIHPLQTFADSESAVRSLPGSSFGVTCDPEMEGWATGFVTDLGGRALKVRDGDKVLYHAAAVLACNVMLMVEHAAQWVYGLIGFGEEEAGEAYLPLVRATVENLERIGPSAALTGPLARGDVGTLRAHLSALEPYPELADLYRAASAWGLKMVAERGEVSAEVLEEMRGLFDGKSGV